MKTEAMCRSEFITNFNYGCKVNYVVFIFASSLAGWTFNLLYDYCCINNVRGSLTRSLPFNHKKKVTKREVKDLWSCSFNQHTKYTLP